MVNLNHKLLYMERERRNLQKLLGVELQDKKVIELMLDKEEQQNVISSFITKAVRDKQKEELEIQKW